MIFQYECQWSVNDAVPSKDDKKRKTSLLWYKIKLLVTYIGQKSSSDITRISYKLALQECQQLFVMHRGLSKGCATTLTISRVLAAHMVYNASDDIATTF